MFNACLPAYSNVTVLSHLSCNEADSYYLSCNEAELLLISVNDVNNSNEMYKALDLGIFGGDVTMMSKVHSAAAIDENRNDSYNSFTVARCHQRICNCNHKW